MKTPMRFVVLILLFALPENPVFVSSITAATSRPQSDKPQATVATEGSGRMSMRIADEVRHQLIMLPYYGIFDWLECEIKPGNIAVLSGSVTRTSTKSDAEAVLGKIEGIPKIENQIQVLPPSPSDDRIRIAAYRSIFKYDGPLFRYAIQSTIPIHIIVNNGRITLKGVVDNPADSQIAYTAANGISGVFEVKNELTVAKNG